MVTIDDVVNILCSWNGVVKLATVVEGNPKDPFSIAATLKFKGGRYSFPWISPLPLIYTLYSWVLSKAVSSSIFKVIGMTLLRIEPWSPGPLVHVKMKYFMSWNMYTEYVTEKEEKNSFIKVWYHKKSRYNLCFLLNLFKENIRFKTYQ